VANHTNDILKSGMLVIFSSGLNAYDIRSCIELMCHKGLTLTLEFIEPNIDYLDAPELVQFFRIMPECNYDLSGGNLTVYFFESDSYDSRCFNLH
jgi:hypothetical protein